jgi:hypothetical protein
MAEITEERLQEAQELFAMVFAAKVTRQRLIEFVKTAEQAKVDLFLFMYSVFRMRYNSIKSLSYKVVCPGFDTFEYGAFLKMLNQEVIATASHDADVILFAQRAFQLSLKECLNPECRHLREVSKVGRYMLLEFIGEMEAAGKYLSDNPSIELFLRMHPSTRTTYKQIALEEGLLGDRP